MTAEGRFNAFREAKMCQIFANSCNRNRKGTEFSENVPKQRLRKYTKSCESRPKGVQVLENAPKVEKLCPKLRKCSKR